MQAIYPGVRVPRGAELSATDRARAALLWSRRDGVIAGLSASAMLGAKWIDADRLAELIQKSATSATDHGPHGRTALW
jgi:hypothetical protein